LRIARAIALLSLPFSTLAQDSVRTLAGRALQNGAQDGQQLEARFNDPAALASDSAGNLYLADTRNHLIRHISPSGFVTTVITSGPAFDTPSGIAISAQGLIVSDTGNHVVRRINPDGSTITIAGAFGQPGFDDGLGAAARFDSPLGLAVATNGVIYVADCGNHTVRAISADNVVTTLAGSAGAWGATDASGNSARFNGPIGLALDSQGNLFVSDSNNHLIRKITPARDVTTFAGSQLENGFADGDGHNAKFFQPAELAFDAHGNLYVADSMNHAIRRISADGKVSTVAGFTKTPGADDGDNQRARFYNPYGVAVLPSGQLAISDSYNQMIRDALPPAELHLSILDAISLNWNSVVGASYQIQIASPSLDAWLDAADPIIATNQTSNANFPLQTGANVFRMLVRP
jgi:sugar lactone lactonase YvrE